MKRKETIAQLIARLVTNYEKKHGLLEEKTQDKKAA